MRRRSLLAAVAAGAAGLAGCNTRPGDTPRRDTASAPATATDRLPTDALLTDDPATDEPEDDPATDEPGDDPTPLDLDGLQPVSLADLETVPRTYALRAGYRTHGGAAVRLRFDGTATATRPLGVTATLTNTNDYADTVELRWTPPFGDPFSDRAYGATADVRGHTDRPALVFAPTAGHDLVDDPPAVTRASDGLWRVERARAVTQPDRVRLAPGETVRGRYALVGRADEVGEGRPPGVYEFSRGGGESLTVTVWPTDTPGPTARSRFAGRSVPSLPGDRAVAWYHEADATTPTYVVPAAERVRAPATLRFTFLNRSRSATRCGHWNLYRLAHGAWHHLGPFVHTSDCRLAVPGDRVDWRVQAATGPLPDGCGCDEQFPSLGGGVYAAVAGYGHATGASGALVELVGPPVTVTATPDATAERDGDTVVVTTDRWRDAPAQTGRRRARLVVTHAETATERLLPETVMRAWHRGLRNGLAFAADASRVVVRTDELVVDRATGYDNDRRRVRFDGATASGTLDDAALVIARASA